MDFILNERLVVGVEEDDRLRWESEGLFEFGELAEFEFVGEVGGY